MNKLISLDFLSGKFHLKGTLHLPDVQKPPVVIGSHGLFSTGNSPKQIALAEKCNEYGIAFFRFDHRGCGDSEGNFETVTSLSGRCEDLIHAVNLIVSRKDIGPGFGLFGSSFGGSTCLAAANRLKPDAIVTVAAPFRIRTSDEAIEIIRKTDHPKADAMIRHNRNLTFDISDQLAGISDLLIFHGDRDSIVPPFHAIEIHREARSPKRLIMLKNGDHPMSDPDHQQRFLREASLWFKAAFSLRKKQMAV